MMPRDRLILAVQGVIGVYVLYHVSSMVYNHLKAKDRLKCQFPIISFDFHRMSLSLFQ